MVSRPREKGEAFADRVTISISDSLLIRSTVSVVVAYTVQQCDPHFDEVCVVAAKMHAHEFARIDPNSSATHAKCTVLVLAQYSTSTKRGD